MLLNWSLIVFWLRCCPLLALDVSESTIFRYSLAAGFSVTKNGCLENFPAFRDKWCENLIFLFCSTSIWCTSMLGLASFSFLINMIFSMAISRSSSSLQRLFICSWGYWDISTCWGDCWIFRRFRDRLTLKIRGSTFRLLSSDFPWSISISFLSIMWFPFWICTSRSISKRSFLLTDVNKGPSCYYWRGLWLYVSFLVSRGWLCLLAMADTIWAFETDFALLDCDFLEKYSRVGFTSSSRW